MEWIYKYEVERMSNVTTVKGDFSASSGSFKIEYEGDGGNADTYTITLSGGQYENLKREPTKVEISGAWEIREVIEMFGLLGKIIDRE
jgi:hypothetical protein